MKDEFNVEVFLLKDSQKTLELYIDRLKSKNRQLKIMLVIAVISPLAMIMILILVQQLLQLL